MKIVLNPDANQHNYKEEINQGKMVPAFENPSRLNHILNHFKRQGHDQFISPQDFGLEPIAKIHNQDYLTFLQNIWHQWQITGNQSDILPSVWKVPGLNRPNSNNLTAQVGSYAFSADTPIMKGTWQAVYQGAQSALTATQLVCQGNRSAFALTRPPGHHAHSALYGGYCFINNAAVAAQAAIDYHKDKEHYKVAILDVDFHHGNGTQDIFYKRSDVLTISIHGDPDNNFPYYLGNSNETGENEGEGCNLNLPLPDGSNFTTWCEAFAKAQDKIEQFAPDFLIVPLGVDTYENDPISSFKLTTDDYTTMRQMIAKLNLPTVFVMEGGYDIEPLGVNVYNVIAGFEK